MELTRLQQAKIFAAGQEFACVVSEIYGEAEGIRAWNTVADTIDPEIRHYLLMAVLDGRHKRIWLTHIASNHFVSAIKAIRSETGLLLKEAKEMCDRIQAGISKEYIEIELDCQSAAIDRLTAAGITCHL